MNIITRSRVVQSLNRLTTIRPWTVRPRYQSTNTHHHSQPQPPLKVWWDSACPLCTREINLMRKLDSKKRILFIPVNKSTSAEDLPPSSLSDSACPIDKKTLLARFHAQEHGQDIVDGAAAFAAMWRQIPRLRWLGDAARNGVVLWVLERVYRAFLVVRPGLQWVVKKIERYGISSTDASLMDGLYGPARQLQEANWWKQIHVLEEQGQEFGRL